jgi:hypothetical protein
MLPFGGRPQSMAHLLWYRRWSRVNLLQRNDQMSSAKPAAMMATAFGSFNLLVVGQKICVAAQGYCTQQAST